MDEKEIVRNSLMTKYMLATMSEDEILEATKDSKRAEEFINGLANIMKPPYICYTYQYNSIIFKVIEQTLIRDIELTDDTRQAIYEIITKLKEYLKHDKEYKAEFKEQYEYLERQNLGIDPKRLDITLRELDSLMLPIFDKLNSGNIADIKTDRHYLATISYLANHFPLYLRNSFMIMEVKKSLLNVNKNKFVNHKQYSIFKRVASKTLSTIEKSYKLKDKVKEKTKDITEN